MISNSHFTSEGFYEVPRHEKESDHSKRLFSSSL